jgi:hypothetical protein
VDQSSGHIDRTSSSQVKIALFRSLFRGREDVYPRRFESRKTGRSGYAPAFSNEWVRGICEKRRIKCAECPHCRFLPVTDEVIRWHLSGHDLDGESFVAGVYPLLRDETCFFLAVDFDKSGWRDDALAFLEACSRLQLPASLERSRSGSGGHVWLFGQESSNIASVGSACGPFADRRQGPSDRYAATVRALSCRRVRQRMVHSVICERLLKELHDF